MKALRIFLTGLLLVPAILGILLIVHVFIKSKYDANGKEITNRIARLELVWLAMNKPKLFCRDFEWACKNVEARHRASGVMPPRDPDAKPSSAKVVLTDRDGAALRRFSCTPDEPKG